MKSIRLLVAAILLTAIGMSSISCNTIRGMGRDVERGGEEIQDATRD